MILPTVNAWSTHPLFFRKPAWPSLILLSLSKTPTFLSFEGVVGGSDCLMLLQYFHKKQNRFVVNMAQQREKDQHAATITQKTSWLVLTCCRTRPSRTRT
ncbi:unnamed protein product [Ectocarpus sp. 12 AP-2014]